MALASIGVMILFSVLALHLPRSIPSGNFGDEWSNVCTWVAMAAGAFLFANTCPALARPSLLDRLTGVFAAVAKELLAAFMIAAAILHIRFAAPIAQFYIPAYLPWRSFRTYFTAMTLAAGGVGLLLPPTERLAALLTSLMIFLWFLLLHIPRTCAEPRNPAEWAAVFESLAFAAMAFALGARARRRNVI